MKRKLQTWIEKCIIEKTYLDYNDLHIDELKKTFKKKKYWINGGVQVLKKANDILQKGFCNFTVSLALSLLSDEQPLGINFTNSKTLAQQFDDTPPSLYIFKKGTEPWITMNTQIISLEDAIFDFFSLCYIEYKEEKELEFRRSVWISMKD